MQRTLCCYLLLFVFVILLLQDEGALITDIELIQTHTYLYVRAYALTAIYMCVRFYVSLIK